MKTPREHVDTIRELEITERIEKLKKQILREERFISIEQARLITRSYRENEDQPRNVQRARSLERALTEISIRIDPEELIVGNRTPGIRAGVVFPEAGIEWINEEIEDFPKRPQDRFSIRNEDIDEFKKDIYPYWRGKGLRDEIERAGGQDIKDIEKVVKINQKDHAQGHICPHTEKWLGKGPAGLKREVERKLAAAKGEKREFYQGLSIVLEASRVFIRRYGELADEMSENRYYAEHRENLQEIARICLKLADHPPDSFREAVQSVWFLFVILQMESNASSFSPGRLDQILYPYLIRDMERGGTTLAGALEITEALWLKFNQIVYLRNSTSARYFAGFPIGFNVALGGKNQRGEDGSNILSHLFLRAQAHIGLPQPNLSARLHDNSPDELLEECSRVIGLGSGMPQVFNDESIVPALEQVGIEHEDALNYAIVGCVELTTHGNSLGWSDAAMFNMVKVLELTLNNGICMLTHKQIGLPTGYLWEHESYEAFEKAYRKQLDHFIERMISVNRLVDRLHARFLPSPFLSSVIDDCIEKGMDVTEGGAHYNLSGVQAIQVANVADSLAALKKLVFDERSVEPRRLIEALRRNFEEDEPLRQRLMNRVPKYGNDVAWVDEIGHQWIRYFTTRVSTYRNVRGGPYHTGLYTVSAHVPMGKNVGATPDGRYAEEPLADGGMSAVYGRDHTGPTALLKSVSRIDSLLGSNGTLLNMKFLPQFFRTEPDIRKFATFLRTFVKLRIHHVQFNVIRNEDLMEAKKKPERHRSLTVRVAGYTAYFTELASDLQDEIIARTCYSETL
jgi:pyruvate formate-lyase/glycerol dehydratase family glycyl radical enzyme